jgi:hypothetical protein
MPLDCYTAAAGPVLARAQSAMIMAHCPGLALLKYIYRDRDRDRGLVTRDILHSALLKICNSIGLAGAGQKTQD